MELNYYSKVGSQFRKIIRGKYIFPNKETYLHFKISKNDFKI